MVKLGYFFSSICFLSLSVFSQGSLAKEKESCACEPVQCGPCQKPVTVGTTVKFCDWGDMNVCRDIICENVSFYFSCLSKLESEENKDKDEGEEVKELTLDYEEDRRKYQKESPPKEKGERGLASEKKKPNSPFPRVIRSEGRKEVGDTSRVDPIFSEVSVGHIASSSQGLKVFHRGQTRALKNGEKLYVGDEILNSSGENKNFTLNFAKGRVHFELKNKTKLSMEDPHSILGRFQPFAYLVHGSVNYKVEMDQGGFDLLAGQVLVRAEQGHQQVGYEMEERGLIVKVESLKGGLKVLRARDLSGKTISVPAGKFVSWVSETPGHLFNRDEKTALAGEGFVTPVFVMSPARKKELGVLPVQEKPLFADWTDRKEEKAMGQAGRQLASADALCQAPQAQYQQCVWSCEGNARGASSCEAQKEGVHCVRRECNAAGQWGAPTPFASSYSDLCPAQGVRVGACGP